jgi:predicted DNA-binding WGR domain protein
MRVHRGDKAQNQKRFYDVEAEGRGGLELSVWATSVAAAADSPAA